MRLHGSEGKIGLLEIADRDAWQCHICERPVKRQAIGNAKPSLDHVIAVSRGGGHTRENLALAHLGCNIAKKDRDYVLVDGVLRTFPNRTGTHTFTGAFLYRVFGLSEGDDD